MDIKNDFLENLIRTYEKYIAPITFLAGFVFDTFTLRRIDFWLDHLVLLSYLALAGAGIIVLSAYGMGRLRFRILDVSIPMLPVVIQFAFGGLFSAFTIFYFKSSAPTISWIFLLTLAVLLIGNERFRKYYEKLPFQLGVFFFVVFSYTIFLVPIIFKRIGTDIFLISGVASLGVFVLFLLLLWFLTGETFQKTGKTLFITTGSIYLIFNILYFTNIIPPIPLALKEAGVYHSVRRTATGDYEVSFEPAPWYNFLQETSTVYRQRPGEPVYVFTSVFAPTKFNLTVLHLWRHYDEEKGEWVERERIPFPINGGRDGGWRGYTYKTFNITPGRWRVDVITDEGRILGRQSFTIVKSEDNVELATSTK